MVARWNAASLPLRRFSALPHELYSPSLHVRLTIKKKNTNPPEYHFSDEDRALAQKAHEVISLDCHDSFFATLRV